MKVVSNCRKWALPSAFAFALIFGGAAQNNLLGDLFCRIIFSVYVSYWFFSLRYKHIHWQFVEKAIVLLIILVPLVQLVPLPPTLWTALGGRGVYVAAFNAIREPLPWMPISATPLRTWDGLLFCVLPVGAYFAGRSAGEASRVRIFLTTLIVALLSLLLGLVQVLSAQRFWRFYPVTNDIGAVGLFANRNHFALLCAVLIPIFFMWLVQRQKLVQRAPVILVTSALISMTLATQSRAGIALATIALVMSAAWAWPRVDVAGKSPTRFAWWLTSLAIGGAVLFAWTLPGRIESLRLNNPRAEITPQLVQAAFDQMPFGSGVGSFPSLFERYERSDYLAPQYWNHAHNDIIEVVIESGLFGILGLMVVATWLFNLFKLASQNDRSANPDVIVLRLALIVLTLAFLHSFVDYPLRTPALATLIACIAGMATSAYDRLRQRRLALCPEIAP